METRCIHLAGAVCRASLSGMVPRLFEYDALCKSSEHSSCPVLKAFKERGEFEELYKIAV
ncbi:hypothetical protein KJ039_06700 [bacterium]|nr:hypothetical protein [bacterium]